MKKILSLILAIILVTTSLYTVAFATQKGDVDSNGKITAVDARLILQYVAGLKAEGDLKNATNADVDGNGKITAVDARIVLQIVADLVEAPTHTHSYSEPTCTEPAKCSCGVTDGSALGHFYENRICIRCGKTDPSKPAFNPIVEYPKELLYDSRGYIETGVWNHYSYLIKDYSINGNKVVLKCQLSSIVETNSQFITTGTSRNDFNNFPVKLDACVVLDYFTYTYDGTPYDSNTATFDLRNYKVGDIFEFEFYISDHEKVSKVIFKQP